MSMRGSVNLGLMSLVGEPPCIDDVPSEFLLNPLVIIYLLFLLIMTDDLEDLIKSNSANLALSVL